MYHQVLGDARLPEVLLRFDEDLARRTRERGCGWCQAALHSANYARKVRSGPWVLGPEHDLRHSLCCSREGCRRRATPQSVRFLSRRVYLSAVIVLAATMMQGPTAFRVTRLEAQLGISRRTLARWQKWWVEVFPKTTTWHTERSLFVPPVDESALPYAVLERFVGQPMDQLLSFLRFMMPLSVGFTQAT